MEAGILTKQIENAQKKVEEQNFVTRKNVLKYDDVMNAQREVIYAQRRQVLEGQDLSGQIADWIDSVVEQIALDHTAGENAEWDADALFAEMSALYDCEVKPEELDLRRMTREEVVGDFQDDAHAAYEAKEEEVGPELMREIERYLVLQVVDARWREHLDSMEYLRDGIHLRAMAQKDPLVEYRNEGSAMFEELGALIRDEVVRHLFHVEVKPEEAGSDGAGTPAHFDPSDQGGGSDNLVYEHESLAGADAIAAATGRARPAPPAGAGAAAGARPAAAQTVTRADDPYASVGRNDPCPCGSGKKFKRCHGA
jgi:preprotein translocase subunit SecA